MRQRLSSRCSLTQVGICMFTCIIWHHKWSQNGETWSWVKLFRSCYLPMHIIFEFAFWLAARAQPRLLAFTCVHRVCMLPMFFICVHSGLCTVYAFTLACVYVHWCLLSMVLLILANYYVLVKVTFEYPLTFLCSLILLHPGTCTRKVTSGYVNYKGQWPFVGE